MERNQKRCMTATWLSYTNSQKKSAKQASILDHNIALMKKWAAEGK